MLFGDAVGLRAVSGAGESAMTDTPLGGGPPSAGGKTTVGSYEIIAKIGQGAMGTVFKARQTSMDRIVALKILKPSLAKDDAFLDRFLREVRAAAQLNHPNIVQAYDAGQASGYIYFAMELVDGHSLQTILHSGGPLPEERALQVTRDIALALECAHNAGVIHRDVKPDNILVAVDNTAKLADLGIAHRTNSSDASLTQAGMALGTPNYISPEQVRGEMNVDSRADIYSLGATLYHMLTGAPPYLGGTNAEVMSMHLTKPVPNARAANPRISVRTNALIRKAMAKNRNDRHATAHEFLADVEMLLNETSATVTAQPKPVLTAPTHPRKRRTKPAISGAKIAMFATLIVFFAAIGIYALVSEPGADPHALKDARALAAVEQWVADHPGRYHEALTRYRGLDRTVTNPQCKQTVEAAIASITTTRDKAADKVFANLKAKAEELKKTGAYAEASRVYNTAPSEFNAVLRARTRQAIAAVDAEARTKIKLGMERGRALLEKGDAAAGLKELDKAMRIRYAAFVEQRQVLRKELERAAFEQALAARKEVTHLLQTIDTPAAKGDLRAAARAAQAASLDPALKCVKASAEALAQIGAALLKAAAAPNNTLTARTPDEHITVAILALAAEDPARMAAALKKARDHEFASQYATKLQQLKQRLQEREADKQEQQRTRLVEFRANLGAALKTHQYRELVAALDAIIADPQLPLIREEAMADRRAFTKLAKLLQRIRSNVRVEARKEKKTPTRWRGIPATIENYDSITDKVTFSRGQPAAISAMRATDLKMLLDLSPGPAAAYDESLALLFLAGGQPQRAGPHTAKVTQRGDIERLKKILGEAAGAVAGGPDPVDNTEPELANLTSKQKEDLQPALAKNRELFKKYWRTVEETRAADMKAYEDGVSGTWNGIVSAIADYQRRVRYLQSDAARDYYYSSSLRRNLRAAEEDLARSKIQKVQLAKRMKARLFAISKKASSLKSAVRTVMLKHKRLLLGGKKLTEERMTAAYEKATGGGR